MATDLITQIMNTLPPFVAGQDRQFHFEPDGTLVYTHKKGDWEPPCPIDGFGADPNDLWRFRPLWSHCAGRLHTAVRSAACGSIILITRCNKPQARYKQRVTYAICKQCPFQEKKDAM